MVGRHQEFVNMFHAERELWWYKILHKKVCKIINVHFSTKTITILDAGCGTGGLLSYLSEQGFKNIEGIDLSDDAITYSQQRHLKVLKHDITKIAEYKPSQKYDVIVSNDVFTYLSDEDITAIFKNIASRLNPNGVFITNNNALKVFAGIHDVLAGGQKRFSTKDILSLSAPSKLQPIHSGYWSVLLSPLIMAIRTWHRFKIKRGMVDFSKEHSDVSVPPKFINSVLYSLVAFEDKILPSGFIGSSLFMVFKNNQ